LVKNLEYEEKKYVEKHKKTETVELEKIKNVLK